VLHSARELIRKRPGTQVVTIQTEMEEWAKRLETTGDYKVLRRLVARTPTRSVVADRIGIILDLETTGLDTSREEVVEVAMVKFGYTRGDDKIQNLIGVFQAFNQPSAPLSPEIVELTGITDDMVAGRRIDAGELATFISDASIVIAHNASFDRKFAERYWPLFAKMNWACSSSGIDWKSHGFPGARLAYLLAEFGMFHGAHRALDDCRATMEILAREVPSTGKSGLALLLERARRPSFRVWAERSAFEFKDQLRKRGYRWNDGADGRPRSWYVDIDGADLGEEMDFLRTQIYQADVEILHRAVTARDRFSDRI
jgi:DNA polymerase-3 subunit epsilon